MIRPFFRLPAFRPFAAVLIALAATGCDNITWGGVQVSLQSASAPVAQTAEEIHEEEVPPPPTRGPALFLVERDPGSGTGAATLVPLAKISGDSLLPIESEEGSSGFSPRFIREHLQGGARFILFAEGTRVGTFQPGRVIRDDSAYCSVRPRVSGIVELVPEAAGVDVFLALRQDGGEPFTHGPFNPLQSTFDQRVGSLNLAGELFPRFRAAWPPSVLDARRDLRIFAVGGLSDGAVAATFVHRDVLGVGAPPAANSYALFFIAEDRGAGYRPEYVWYRSAEDGKAVPRFLGHLDWSGDGGEAVVMEVSGAEKMWFAAAARRDGRWRTIYQDPCGQAASAGHDGPLD